MFRFTFVLALLLATVSFVTRTESAMNFDCDGHGCGCEGTADCNDMRRSGMCAGDMTCHTTAGILKCFCTSAKTGGGVSKQPPAATGTKTNKQ
jgi:hypothetical protein